MAVDMQESLAHTSKRVGWLLGRWNQCSQCSSEEEDEKSQVHSVTAKLLWVHADLESDWAV